MFEKIFTPKQVKQDKDSNTSGFNATESEEKQRNENLGKYFKEAREKIYGPMERITPTFGCNLQENDRLALEFFENLRTLFGKEVFENNFNACNHEYVIATVSCDKLLKFAKMSHEEKMKNTDYHWYESSCGLPAWATYDYVIWDYKKEMEKLGITYLPPAYFIFQYYVRYFLEKMLDDKLRIKYGIDD